MKSAKVTTLCTKRNPVACPIIMSIGNKLREKSNSSQQWCKNMKEVFAMPLEWLVIPEAFVLLSEAFSTLFQCWRSYK